MVARCGNREGQIDKAAAISTLGNYLPTPVGESPQFLEEIFSSAAVLPARLTAG
jgi:hypothetical protein